MSKRIRTQHTNPTNNIVIRFDCSKVTQQSFDIILNLSEILQESAELGTMELDIFNFEIKSLKTYEKDLIVCQ